MQQKHLDEENERRRREDEETERRIAERGRLARINLEQQQGTSPLF